MTKQHKVQVIGLLSIGAFWLIASWLIRNFRDFTAAVGFFALLLALALAQGDPKEPPRG